ncbi:MAG: hypothetical protein CFE25_03740 [Chitinophagaceae bacterium BSSC1]|jgi:hypothetical protein|nr:MAG: hypothetical protein CFE25_03740 [Chitinophagaceae bacterium BSSC1]
MLTKTLIEKYFLAEKQESLLFISIGIIAVILAVLGWLYFKTAFWKGASIPFLAIALLQIIVGYTVYSRSDEQRIDIVYSLDMNPEQLTKVELPRMEVVNKNFVIYRWVEIALALVGMGLYVYFRENAIQEFWKGFGFALFIQAILMLGADYFAEKRAHEYTAALSSFSVKK